MACNIDYVRASWDRPAAGSLLPGARNLGEYLLKRFPGGLWIGGYMDRATSDGKAPSQHRHGATIDIRWNDDKVRAEVMDWLVKYQCQLQIQRIHDYYGSRAFYTGDTDDGQKLLGWHTATGKDFGEPWAQWLHIEQTPSGALDTRTIDQRIAPAADLTGIAEILALIERVRKDPVHVGEHRSHAVAFVVWAFGILDDGKMLSMEGGKYTDLQGRRVMAFKKLWNVGKIDSRRLDGPTMDKIWERVLLKLKK